MVVLIQGRYAPVNYDPFSDPFPSPAPGGPYSANLSQFNGTNPNGNWSLYVFNDNGFGAFNDGNIADGWQIQVFTADPPAVGISINDVEITEGNGAARQAVFTVNLSQASNIPISVNYATADGTARVADDDYLSENGNLVFNPGQTSQTISIPIVGDTVSEPSRETFFVNLSGVSGSGASIADSQGIGTIINDDIPLPVVSISNATVSPEGNRGTKPANFTVSLNQASTVPVTVRYSTRNGTAESPDDYVAKNGSVTFNPGQTRQTITVNVKGDDIPESRSETFTVNLSGASNAEISDTAGVGTGTITDDDGAFPAISVSDITVVEGDRGTQNARFTVSLSKPSAGGVSVEYATVAGSARSGRDFTNKSDTLTFARGQRSQTISIPIKGDTIVEPTEEQFFLQLSEPELATITRARAVATIIDNDAPSLSISNNVRIIEKDSGTQQAKFTVSLSSRTDERVSVKYTVANGSARSGSDFSGGGGTLTFNPGQTRQIISVAVRGDRVIEGDEDFSVRLSQPRGASIRNGTGFGEIKNDDFPDISIDDVRIREGNRGTQEAVFQVSLSTAPFFPVRVSYATSSLTARSPGDFSSKRGSVTFRPGDTRESIVIPIKGDTEPESIERFSVRLSRPVNGNLIDTEGIATITDNDRRRRNSFADNLFGVSLETNSFETIDISEYSTNINTRLGLSQEDSLIGKFAEMLQIGQTSEL